MFVGELILRRTNVKVKILELQKRLETHGCADKDDYDNNVSELFNLISDLQSFSIILNRSNNNSKVRLGEKDITISDAIEIRNTLNRKISVFSGLINKTPEYKFSIPKLLKQRDELQEELFIVNRSITMSDWSTNVS